MSELVIDKPGKKIDLKDLPTDPPKGITKEEAAEKLKGLSQEMFELQDLMWGAKTHAVLVVLQGRDAAGKDGTIKTVVGALNPRGVSVVSFGVPTDEERAHDFLWRVHRHAPRMGEFAIFNRSHYEDVLVVRVHELVEGALWKEHYGHINDFEELLSEHHTIVLKFFLHISKREQEERLLQREEDPAKSWKVNPNDWSERQLWGEFTEAYQDVFERCSTRRAPWHVVPADAKWYRNLVVAETIVDALRPFRKGWQKVLDAQARDARARMQEFRKEHKAGH